MTPTRRLWIPIALGLALPVAVTSCQGCKKDEPPPPLPSATAPATTSAPVLELAVEDAGPDADASDGAKKVGTGGAKKSGLTRCCQALKQNAANAPPPTNAYMANLAASCFALAAQGKEAFPQGAAFSPACK